MTMIIMMVGIFELAADVVPDFSEVRDDAIDTVIVRGGSVYLPGTNFTKSVVAFTPEMAQRISTRLQVELARTAEQNASGSSPPVQTSAGSTDPSRVRDRTYWPAACPRTNASPVPQNPETKSATESVAEFGGFAFYRIYCSIQLCQVRRRLRGRPKCMGGLGKQ
jgi:hypothetical protein